MIMNSEGVYIQVEHVQYGSFTGSGLKINNVIITHGSLLAPLCLSTINEDDLIDNNCNILQYLRDIKLQNTCDYKALSQSVQFKILCKKETLSPFNFDRSKARIESTELNIDKDHILEEATLYMMYNYKSLTNTINNTLNWTNSNGDEIINEVGNLLHSTFIFLMLGKQSEGLFKNTLHSVFSLVKTILSPGTNLIIESTPFGNISLFNSWTRGIISKMLDRESGIFVTDARLVPGCEGGPIYIYKDGRKDQLVGLVVGTSSWCDGQISGFSLGINLRQLCKGVLGLTSTIDYIPFAKLRVELPPSLVNLDLVTASVVFVRCRYKWGSGVVVDSSSGIILTCSHIIDHDHNAVFISSGGHQSKAHVVYTCPHSSPYDLAVLRVGRVDGLKQLKFADTPPVLGETVVAAGYPLYRESLVDVNTTPTLTSGCVAKASRRGGPVQTTCCTQSGLSGGALIRPPSQLLGLVVCNVRYDTVTLPHFSFAVSVEDIKTAITAYLHSKDESHLHSLSTGNWAAKMEWSLRDSKI